MKLSGSIRSILIVAVAASMFVACGKKKEKKPAATTQTNALNNCTNLGYGQSPYGYGGYGGYNQGFGYNPQDCTGVSNPFSAQYTQGGVMPIAQAKAEIAAAFAQQPFYSRVAFDKNYTYSNNSQSYSLGGILNFNFSYGTGWGYPTNQQVVLNTAQQILDQMDNTYMPGSVQVATPVAQRNGNIFLIKYQGTDGTNSYETTYQYDLSRQAAFNPTHVYHMKYGFNSYGQQEIVSGNAILRQ